MYLASRASYARGEVFRLAMIWINVVRGDLANDGWLREWEKDLEDRKGERVPRTQRTELDFDVEVL